MILKGVTLRGASPSSFNKTRALEYMQDLDPVALWVPGMQEDGFRVDGDTTYLTQLTDLSGNGNHAVQATDTAQAYLDGADAVFSGAQWYGSLLSGSTIISINLSIAFAKKTALNGFVFDFYDSFYNNSFSISQYQSTLNFVKAGLYDLPTDGSLICLSENLDKVKLNGTFYIGRYRSSTRLNLRDGTISTLALYNKTLTAEQQLQVNQCLNVLGA